MSTSSHPASASAPPGDASALTSSLTVWLVLVAYLGLVKLTLDLFLPHAFADPAQATLFGWVPLGIFSGLGLVGVWLSHKTGFPSAWDANISLRKRVLMPLLIGVGFGLLQVVIDLFTGFSQLIAARHGLTQQYTDFPSMLLIFTAAPVIVEVIYRLFLVPLLLWLISNVMLKKRAQEPVFWILAVLTSTLEPVSQFQDLQILSTALTLFLVLECFAINLVQAWFFRRHGFLAAILVRVGFYLAWHVAYIH